jgi:membrane-bound lytic murein transglycosylase D
LQAGETLFSVAEKLQVPLDSIIDWNQITESTLLKPGVVIKFRPAQELLFEQEEAAKKLAKKPTLIKPAVQPTVVPPAKVEAPVTKPEPAKVPAQTPAPAKVAPALSPALSPAPSPAPAKALPPTKPEPNTAAPTYHTVAQGETLYRISKQYNLTVQQLLDLNGKSTNTISVGEKLVVKK